MSTDDTTDTGPEPPNEDQAARDQAARDESARSQAERTDAAEPAPAAPSARHSRRGSGAGRVAGIVTLVAGIVLVVAGVTTWFVIKDQLADERITVSDDSPRWAGDPVDGPLTAYQEANMIEKHALEATGGKTYAELDREDPLRQTAMTASFLRASLFTSVVAFGVAAMAVGLGIVFLFVGWALMALSRRPAVVLTP